MPLSSLLPAGGAAVGLLAARTIAGLSRGLAAGFQFESALSRSNVHADSPDADTVVTDTLPTVNLEELVPKFAAVLRDRLRAAGAAFSSPLTLKGDGNGGVLVDGEHPGRAAIEALFAHDSELRSQFHEIAAAATAHRHSSPAGRGNPFDEFRLNLAGQSAAIYFE